MNAIPYWIQRADFSVMDGPPVIEADAVRAFLTHDWEAELAFRAQLAGREQEWCDPGIGFVAPDGRVLHICPHPGATADAFYRFQARRRLLGLFPRSTEEARTAYNIDRAQAARLIEHFFASRHEQLLHLLRD